MESFSSPQILSGFDRHEFYTAFKAYCNEIHLQFFRLSAVISAFEKEGVRALAILNEDKVCAFLLYSMDTLKSSFFEKPVCFLRELWTDPRFRHQGLATCLMRCVEMYCHETGMQTLLLTTQTADDLYLSLDYVPARSIRAENNLHVYIKNL